jgi:hypothetical protein
MNTDINNTKNTKKNPATDAPFALQMDVSPYEFLQKEKTSSLLPQLEFLTHRHYEHCKPYRSIIDKVYGGIHVVDFTSLEGIPFIPVQLFKKYELKSVQQSDVVRVLTSSGTTGQTTSKIHLDAHTARSQSTVLIKIMQHCLGKKRLPMVIFDTEEVVKNKTSFSARGAGILGMMQFGYKPFYALDKNMLLNVDKLKEYLAQFSQTEPVFLFGFTFMVWSHFIRALEEAKVQVNIPNGILVHSGGWKKLQDEAVDAAEFRRRVFACSGITKSWNFYGMVEQVGSIFLENPLNYLHAPLYADVIIRDPRTLEPLPFGKPGLVQVLSSLPWSYPGHSLLTEDLGILQGEDAVSLTMKGRYFEILGRVSKAEIRGCSDTYQSSSF